MARGIRKNGNRYQGRFMFDGKNYSVTADTITECKRQMEELRTKLNNGDIVITEKITLDQWFETWLNEYKANDLKEGTIINYQHFYNYYIKKPLGGKQLKSISGESVQKLYNDLLREGYALSTVKIISAILSGCFKRAVKNHKMAANSVGYAELPRAKKKEERRVLSVEEQAAFMKAAEGSYLGNLFSLMLRTGMRGGEARGLKFCDVDMGRNVIHVQRTLKYEAGMGFFESTPKTASSDREIPMTKEVRAIIEKQKKLNREMNNVLSIDGNEYVFHLPEGTPISRERVQNEIDRIIKKASADGTKIERFTPHTFRHTFATRAIENGMKPQTLKAILGHSSLAMTMDLYSHVLPTTKAEEMEKIAQAF